MLIPGIIELSEVEIWAIIGYLVLMCLDVLIGLVCSIIRGDFSSTVMREGAGHKVVCIFYIIVAFVLQVLMQHVTDLNLNIPAIAAICAYFIVMEVRSITETLERTYPELTDVFNNAKDE